MLDTLRSRNPGTKKSGKAKLALEKNGYNETCHSKSFDKKSERNLLSQVTWALVMTLYFVAIISLVYVSFIHLPTPKTKATSNPEDFLEEEAWLHLSTLVGFGHRPSGSTANEKDAVQYILQTVQEIKKMAPPSLKVEVDVQHPTGSFAIDFLGGFASHYSNVTNTIVKISPVAGRSKHGLLLNCHTDTAIGSPGASDDGIACAVLLEVMRAFVKERKKPLLHPIVFLFNGAEENVLQASHGFITQHPWAKEIEAFINLEAAGAGGKEVVFQTGPSNPWLAMTWAAHAPHPFGSILAQEMFQSGVIPADTDFRIFRDYGKIPGIDLAYMRNGYVYHTPYDNLDMIHPGSIQRAGDNILAVVRHLVKSKSSLLPNPNVYRHGETAFMDILGLYMIIVPFRLLVIFNWACSLGGLLLVMRRIVLASEPGFANYGKQLIVAVGTVILSWAACLATVLIICALLTILGKSMSYYSMPTLVVFLYALPGFLAILAVHRVVRSTMYKNVESWRLEALFFDAYLFLWSLILFQTNYLKIQSSFIMLFCVAPILLMRCVFCKTLFGYNSDSTSMQRLLFYLAALVPHTLVIISHATMMMEMFIPLLNRSGSVVPPDLIIATVVALIVCFATHFVLSTTYVVRSLKGFMMLLLFSSIVAFLFASSSYAFPYAASRTNPIPKRLYIQHTQREFYKGTSKLKEDTGLWINSMDYIGFSVDMGSQPLKAAPPMASIGLFGQGPWLLPVYHFVQNPRYLPAAKPTDSSLTTMPFNVAITSDEMTLISENATTRFYKKRLSFHVTGPAHMSIQMGTLKSKDFSAVLTKWSLDGNFDEVKLLPVAEPLDDSYSYQDWWFIYYGSGVTTLPWKPWFEFMVYSDKETDNTHPVVELAFIAHYYSSDRRIPVPGQTADVRAFKAELHDWVTPISWISIYKNYIF